MTWLFLFFLSASAFDYKIEPKQVTWFWEEVEVEKLIIAEIETKGFGKDLKGLHVWIVDPDKSLIYEKVQMSVIIYS